MPPDPEATGRVFKIQRHCLHDGPGIRTLVFFKGCPLSCLWCFNPESHSTQPQIMREAEKCLGCGACLEVCPVPGAIKSRDSGLEVDHELCNGCGLCVPACPGGAMRLFGETMNLSEVMREVKKDLVFYRRSGGGVTLSGGEVAMQPEFASAILQSSNELGIHTAIETSGYAPWPGLEKIVRHCDLVLFDLKAMDPLRHRELTGKDNALILDNARSIAESGRSMIIRIPLIPGCNDTEQNISDTARFIKERLPGVHEAHLLPYEMFGEVKYHKLGRSYQLEELRPPDPEVVQSLADLLSAHGLEVSIRG